MNTAATPPLRLVVSGATGRMGAALARLAAEDESIELLGGIGRSTIECDGASTSGYLVIQSPESADRLLRDAEAVIDFSSPALLRRLIQAQGDQLAGRALVVGTTGLGSADVEALEELAQRSPVLAAANFSIGVHLLIGLAEQAGRVLGTEYDVEIVELHHRRKADAPSGTALELGRAVARGQGSELARVRRDGRSGTVGERPPGEIGFHAVRGGDIVGEHRVLLIGERERLELAHVAADRALFAAGAMRAAHWMTRRPPGSYTMQEMLGMDRPNGCVHEPSRDG